MPVQVVTDAVLCDRAIEAQRVSFIRRSDVVRGAAIRRIVPTGRINVSTPKVTVPGCPTSRP